MKKILLALLLVSCVQNKKTAETDRLPSSAEETRLVYITYKENASHRDEINLSRWRGENGGFSEGGREDYLLKMYYANTVGISNRGLRHLACFHGNANDIAKSFFDSKYADTKIRNLKSEIIVKASSDGRILGLQFNHNQKGKLFFRMSNCGAGKGEISSVAKVSGREPNNTQTMPDYRGDMANNPAFGFGIVHKAKIDKKVMPEFVLRADYDKATKKEKLPWAGFDLRDERDALMFTLLVQKYFYENMANQDRNLNYNFIPQNNNRRYWCHMPWMHVGIQGREAVHGLTQERDMRPSASMPVFKNATPGTNWGVAYFNDSGCRTLNDIFGTVSKPKKSPDFGLSDFEDGTVITKMLFTTSNFKEIERAYPWYAHVSDVGSTERQFRLVRHIQMDIAVKDSTLKGVNPALKNWMMAAFYYDPNYDYDREYKKFLGIDNPLNSIPGLPKELYRMRPMGVQTGFDKPDTGDTLVFAGSFTNGSNGRLNGPADNPKSSCLGCHGVAGTPAPMVPGFLSMKMYEPHQNTQTFLDFNQQLALAKANYETQVTD